MYLKPLEVGYPEEEKRIHAALKQYTKLRQAKAADNAEKFATDFVLMTLKKRLFSSPAAFLRTLEQHEHLCGTPNAANRPPSRRTASSSGRSTGWRKNTR